MKDSLSDETAASRENTNVWPPWPWPPWDGDDEDGDGGGDQKDPRKEAREVAKKVLDFETEIAKASLDL